MQLIETNNKGTNVLGDFPALCCSNCFDDKDSDFIVVVRFEGVDAIHPVNPGFSLDVAERQAFELTKLSYGMSDEQAIKSITVSTYKRYTVA